MYIWVLTLTQEQGFTLLIAFPQINVLYDNQNKYKFHKHPPRFLQNCSVN